MPTCLPDLLSDDPDDDCVRAVDELVLPATAASCSETVPVFADGRLAGDSCPEDAVRAGLTIVDLSEDWAPRVLAGDGLQPAPYRERYVRIARAELGEGDRWDREMHDRFFELYGIFPTIGVVRSRMLDDERHACHAAVHHLQLARYSEPIDTWRPLDKQRGDHAAAESLHARLAWAAQTEGVPFDALARMDGYAPLYAIWKKTTEREQVVRELQAHLRCDGLVDTRAADGMLDYQTVAGLEAYMRRHMIVSWTLDDEVQRALVTSSRELDFRQLLRALRERVVDASGVIEDGSASATYGQVLGRELDARAFREQTDDEPLAGAADDLVARFTEAAARALGWTSPDAAVERLRSGSPPARVALELPRPPAYHGAHMDLRVEIDRGDVWYDFPFTLNGNRHVQERNRLPSMVLYARTDDGDVPLVRWPTTIGGWMPEHKEEGRTVISYKESPAGPRVWRDIVAEPRWIPPDSTPPRDLLRPRQGGRMVPRWDTFGPGYASAYGLVMMVHHRVDEHPDGSVSFFDGGIRTHGSVSYASILDGFSHGCHRLHNHRAVRAAGFMLAHRRHEVRGLEPLDHSQSFAWRGRPYRLAFESRGFRYELVPPVEVQVLPGNVRGWSDHPLGPRPMTRPMLERYGDD
jgi:hypothetical protein